MKVRDWTLEGRTAVITGAARGIGAETAVNLAARGMNVVLAGLEAERLEELAERIGTRAVAVSCDVRSSAELDAAMQAALDRFRTIDVVVANAGINVVGSLETTPYERWEEVVEINLLGVMRTVKAALPHVVAQRGYLLPVASVAAFMPLALGANYTAAKHGVHGFAQALRLELAPSGVDVGCAYFGAIDTHMIRASTADPAIDAMMSGMSRVVSRPVPAATAAEAIARGIAERRRRVYAPRRILPLLVAPTLAVPLAERAARRATLRAVTLSNDRARAGAPLVSTLPEDR